MKLIRFAIIISAIAVLSSAALAVEIAPIGMAHRSIGGGDLNAYTQGVEGGTGLNNIGLLIRTWGHVTYRDPQGKFFYIDDGTGRFDGSEANRFGIRVDTDNTLLASGNTVAVPTADYVAVTCIVSTILIDNKVQPNLRPRYQNDVQPM